MNESLLVSLPLFGGYYFATIEYERRYRLARETGYRFYFAVGVYAVHLVAIAAIAVLACYYLAAQLAACHVPGRACRVNELVLQWGDANLVSKYEQFRLMIFALSFLLGRIVAIAFNAREVAMHRAVIRATENNDFETLILRALESDTPILFTLRNQKIYLGWPLELPDPTTERRWMRIIPMASGLRTSFSQDIQFVTNYLNVLERVQNGDVEFDHLEVDDFSIVIRADEIVYAHLFDMVAYRNFER